MKQPRLVALALCVLLSACMSPPETAGESRAAIIDGRPASAMDVDATVALMQGGYPVCTGTLVTPRVVITAAHCVRSTADDITYGPTISPSDVTVVAGALDAMTATADQTYEVAQVWANMDFPVESGGVGEQDVGALLLSHDVTNLTPAPILDPSQLDVELTPDRMMRIAGYGTTDRAGYGENTRLNVGALPFVSHTADELTGGLPNGVDTCYGDSGGPAYVDTAEGTRVVGITSRGVDPYSEACDSGTIFTLAPAFATMIADALGESVTGDASTTPSGSTPPTGTDPEGSSTGSTPSTPGAPMEPASPAPGASPSTDSGPMVSHPLTGGCSSTGAGSPGGFASVLALALLLLAWRRRAIHPPRARERISGRRPERRGRGIARRSR